jgi:hypothetical protein
MNLTQMITSVSALAGDESQVQFTPAQITQYINWGIDEISRRLENLQKQVTFTTLDSVDTVGGVAMPADFDQELHVFWNEIPLTRMDYADYYSGWSGQTDSGNAAFYSVTGYNSVSLARRMVFYPYQAMGRTGVFVRVIYQYLSPDLVVSTDTPVLPEITHEVVVLYALARCKMQENDYQGYQMINKDVDYKIMQLSSMMDEANGFSYPVVRSESGTVSRTDA